MTARRNVQNRRPADPVEPEIAHLVADLATINLTDPPVDYPAAFKALARKVNRYRDKIDDLVEEGNELMARAAADHGVEVYSDEYRHLEIVYGADALSDAVYAEGAP